MRLMQWISLKRDIEVCICVGRFYQRRMYVCLSPYMTGQCNRSQDKQPHRGWGRIRLCRFYENSTLTLTKFVLEKKSKHKDNFLNYEYSIWIKYFGDTKEVSVFVWVWREIVGMHSCSRK